MVIDIDIIIIIIIIIINIILSIHGLIICISEGSIQAGP